MARRSRGFPSHAPDGPTAANVRTIIALERESQHQRSRIERATDRITATASSVAFIVFHVLWFATWISVNTLSPFRFDPFPFSLLTMTVSLEAIMLTAFVLMSQNHLTLLADRRAHIDLQVNLLAERELTAILKVVCLTADKMGVDVRTCDPNLDELLGRTDVKALADHVTDELANSHSGVPPVIPGHDAHRPNA